MKRWAAAAIGLLGALTTAIAYADERSNCMALQDSASMPATVPMMPKLRMNEPMPSAMKKEGMVKGDVAKEADRQDACITKMMIDPQAPSTSPSP